MRYQFHGLHFTCKRREYFELVDDRMDFGVKYCTCWLGFLSSRQPTETHHGMMLRTSGCIGNASRYPSSPSGLGVWFWLILAMSSHRLLVCNEAGHRTLQPDPETVSTIRLRGCRIATRGLNHGPTHPDLRHPPGGRGRRPGQGRAGLGRPERRAEPEAHRERGRARLGRAEGARPPGGAAAHRHPHARWRARGVATVGGLAALVDRSISAANAIGKTADKIGVGVEALQELRFAAKASGVEQQTLDMALQRFTRRAAEAAQGTGEAKDALAQMGIALRDQSGNLRSSEDLLGDVADAFARIEDPAERVRLAFKLFDPRASRWSTCSAAAAMRSTRCASGP